MTKLMESSENLMRVVDNVNERISNLAGTVGRQVLSDRREDHGPSAAFRRAQTERAVYLRVSACATMIGQVASELHSKFDRISAL